MHSRSKVTNIGIPLTWPVRALTIIKKRSLALSHSLLDDRKFIYSKLELEPLAQPGEIGLDDLIMLVFYSSKHGQISGRTAIQKLVYFSMSYLGITGDFIAHYFGPYSSSVDTSLGQLVSMDLLKERAFFIENEKKLYQYLLTETGLKYAKKLAKKNSKKLKVIKTITEAYENIGENKINRFASAAKVHFLAKGNSLVDINTVIQEAASHGWVLNESEIVRSADTIKKLYSG